MYQPSITPFFILGGFYMANKKHIRLNSARDIQRLLSSLINGRLRGENMSQECRDVGYLAKILLDSIQAGELEERIKRMEMLLEEDKNN